ncbi:hypothetical protein G7051_00500 [Dysgonomonas sp. HDW5B]|uniref:YbbC/YhhH family protein n=1 Tax=Dysgonomonas sp. HDW5B TaxID=2714927 RepID=UPI00140C34A1|nr:YbbC/YhhH family protein [Dysgonomonas sp. HDW5B]QIK52905.1 hypothetical protein G7051_00500 [Dysgonomonas sp. HDW5B]
MRKSILFLISFFIMLSLSSQESNKIIKNNVDLECISKDSLSRDYVPDEQTAKSIAEAIWLPIYGERILRQRPYEATLINNIWVVKGLVPEPYRNNPHYRGGTAYIEIRKRDCKILKVTHYR